MPQKRALDSSEKNNALPQGGTIHRLRLTPYPVNSSCRAGNVSLKLDCNTPVITVCCSQTEIYANENIYANSDGKGHVTSFMVLNTQGIPVILLDIQMQAGLEILMIDDLCQDTSLCLTDLP